MPRGGYHGASTRRFLAGYAAAMRRLLLVLLSIPACTKQSRTGWGSDSAGPTPDAFRVVTFNTGTSESMGHDDAPDDGYTGEHAVISDTWYGDGLAWVPAVEATRAFFEAVDADVVGFQEIFWSDTCSDIPPEARGDFVCAAWQAGDPTVAQAVLGDGWQVACHPGHPDKCAAVRRSFGTFAGCDDDFCLEGLAGATVEGCGRGARVGRGVIERVDGSTLTLVNVHGSSGVSTDDQGCRVAQIGQVFVDLDGAPAASGEENLVLGDLNTDPYRFAGFDSSAARWNDFVGDGRDFRWITEVGPDAPGSYQGIADIDHVSSDTFSGGCRVAGLDPDLAPVLNAVYFDHRPVVCDLTR